MGLNLDGNKEFSRGKLSLIACESGKALGEKIAKEINSLFAQHDITRKFKLVDTDEIWFANGEVKTVINESVRGKDLYIIQCMDDPLSNKTVNDNLMALFTAINAAFHADAENVSVLLPQFPYSRQERRKDREGITARIIANILESLGTERVITIDVHAQAIAGFFNYTKFENLSAMKVIVDYFKNHFKFAYEDTPCMVVAPDIGSAERGRLFAQRMNMDLAIIDKTRNYSSPSMIENMKLVGEVENYNIFMGDDMIATGGTILNACDLLKKNGARDIYLACTFPFFNKNAVEKLHRAYEEGLLNKVIGTNAVFRGEEFLEKNIWYEEVSIAQLFAQVMFNINTKRSVSNLFF